MSLQLKVSKATHRTSKQTTTTTKIADIQQEKVQANAPQHKQLPQKTKTTPNSSVRT
jgi:hypothetical protein